MENNLFDQPGLFTGIQNNEAYDSLDFGGADLSDRTLTGCRFVNCSFRNAVLEGLQTEHCVFAGCDLTFARLNASSHRNTAFTNCLFHSANLFGARLFECKMLGSGFEEATLHGIEIVRGDWSYTILRSHNLKGLDLREVNFSNADLSLANLEKADLREADLRHAVLAQASLAGADIRNALTEGVDFRSFGLKGVRMDISQAVNLARAFGATID